MQRSTFIPAVVGLSFLFLGAYALAYQPAADTI